MCCGKRAGGRKGRSRRVVGRNQSQVSALSVPSCWVVLADYADEWDEQDNPDYLWYLAGSHHPDLPSMNGCEGFAVYRHKKYADRRAGQILDHATLVEEWPSAEILEAVKSAKGATPYLLPRRV